MPSASPASDPSPASTRRLLVYRSTAQASTLLHELARPPSARPSSSVALRTVRLLLVGTIGGLLLTARLGDHAHTTNSPTLSPSACIVGGFAVVVLALAHWLLAILEQRHVAAESVLLIKDLGVQLQTRYTSGREESEFVDLGRVRAVVINEGITLQRVVYYLAFVVEGRDALLVAFQHLQPCLEDLLPVYHSVCAVIKASQERRQNERSSGDKRVEEIGKDK